MNNGNRSESHESGAKISLFIRDGIPTVLIPAGLRNRKSRIIIPIFVSHRGCPHQCVFCNQVKITGVDSFSGESEIVEAEENIEEFLSHIRDDGREKQIAFYGGSFTGIEQKRRQLLLDMASRYVLMGKADSIRFSTRPDQITPEIISFLKQYPVKTIELGVQSMDRDVLIRSGRGHSPEDVYRASELIKENGYELGLQMMTGLPGSTPEKDMDTAYAFLDIGPDLVRIYPLLVLRETPLEILYRQGNFVPQDLESAVDLCSQLVPLFRNRGIEVIRVGLQNSDNICENGAVIAGPYHPAFGELVEARIRLHEIEEAIEGSGLDGYDCLDIIAAPNEISITKGHKGANINFLKEKYNIRRIRLTVLSNDPARLLSESK